MKGDNTKFIKGSLDTTNSIVNFEGRYDTILYIINLTTDDIIYNPLHKGRGGSVLGSCVELNYPMDGLSDSDSILVVVDYKEENSIESNINELVEELKISNKYKEIITGDKITNQDI